MKDIWFERAIFISWFCAKPTCKFCFMYTIKDNIKSPNKARRQLSSVLAESIICREYGWKIGFISSGIFAFRNSEIKELLEKIHLVTGYKQWLNIGTLNEKQLIDFKPHLEGVCGTVECINEEIRKDIVPDKPMDEIVKMFSLCDRHGIKKAITIIIGLGETIEDFGRLREFIKEHRIDRVNFYRLVPHEGAIYSQGPQTDYYAKWISLTRKEFPNIYIIAGSWPDRVDEIDTLINSGADAITKFPAIKLFNSPEARLVKKKVESTGNRFASNFTDYKDIDVALPFDPGLNEEIKKRMDKYLKKMRR